jgi:nitrite reductase/ring-hydroxylating ferredoxin subunit
MTTKLIKVAELDQLRPGARKLCTVDDRRIALFNLDGTIYAIDNHCTHRDGPVGAGQLNDTVITCPWHGWRFNVATGRCLEPGGKDLRQYPVSVEGNVVLIDFTEAVGNEKDDGIYSYLVRYGVMGHVSRVGSNRLIPCRRGDRVIVNTDRGLEVGEVLEAPSGVAGNSSKKKPAGELLRVMSEEDQREQQLLDSTQPSAIRMCEQLVAERKLPITIVDVEQLFDGETIMVHYLGELTEKLGPIAVELSNAAGNRRVLFQRIESL